MLLAAYIVFTYYTAWALLLVFILLSTSSVAISFNKHHSLSSRNQAKYTIGFLQGSGLSDCLLSSLFLVCQPSEFSWVIQ